MNGSFVHFILLNIIQIHHRLVSCLAHTSANRTVAHSAAGEPESCRRPFTIKMLCADDKRRHPKWYLFVVITLVQIKPIKCIQFHGIRRVISRYVSSTGNTAAKCPFAWSYSCFYPPHLSQFYGTAVATNSIRYYSIGLCYPFDTEPIEQNGRKVLFEWLLICVELRSNWKTITLKGICCDASTAHRAQPNPFRILPLESYDLAWLDYPYRA